MEHRLCEFEYPIRIATCRGREDLQVARMATLGVDEVRRPERRVLQRQRLVVGRPDNGHVGAALELDEMGTGTVECPGSLMVLVDEVPKVPSLPIDDSATRDSDVCCPDSPHHRAVPAGAVRDISRAEVPGFKHTRVTSAPGASGAGLLGPSGQCQ